MEQNNRLKRLNVEVSSTCNYKCVGCPNNNLPRGHGHMNPKLFFSIFNEVGNNVDGIFLWNYGEPLLHPDVQELFEGIRNYSCKKVISTNGWNLENFRDLKFLTSLDEIIVSINGITPDVYALHQNNGDLEKVIRGVKKISPILDKNKTRLIMQTLAHRGNLSQIEETKDFAEKLGFHEVVIKSFNVMDNTQVTFDTFVPIGTIYSRYKENTPDTKPSSAKTHPCQKSMVINWDGTVNPCCWDYKGRYILGNVSDNGVYGIWSSLMASQLKKRIEDRDFLDICVDCANSKLIKQWNVGKDDVRGGTRSI